MDMWRNKQTADVTGKTLCSALLLLFLCACQEKGLDSALENYVQRLATTLGLSEGGFTPSTTTTSHPPRTGKLQLNLPSSSVDTLDFMSLSGCAVQITIGKRNSSLGKMARPSQRLLLELEYLRLAPACIDSLRSGNKTELANTLAQSWEQKKTQLPSLIFNATLGSEEYRAFWLPAPEAGGYPPVSSSAVISALGSLNHKIRRWKDGDYRANNREFEVLLGEVAGGDGGALLQSLARQDDWLNQANRLLQLRMGKGPLCAPGVRHEAADILPNITQKYFIGEIQPGAAQMERRVYDLIPPITTLEELLTPVLPATYQSWKTERDRLLASARLAPRRHVARLKEILQPCQTSL
jgi:hypothetical protein